MQSKDLYFEQRKFLKALLKDMEKLEQKHDSFYSDYQQILKSQFVLMLYTTIESVVMQSIQDIFDIIKQEKRHFYDLTNNIKQIYFKAKINNKERNFNQIVKDGRFLSLLDEFKETNSIVEIIIKQDFEQENPFKAGSLDCKNIKEYIFGALEIEDNITTNLKKWNHILKQDIASCIQNDIKVSRNALAHGEISFNNFGKDKSIKDLKKYYISVNIFLFYYIKSIQLYVSEKKYVLE